MSEIDDNVAKLLAELNELTSPTIKLEAPVIKGNTATNEFVAFEVANKEKIIVALDAQRLDSFQTCEYKFDRRHNEYIDIATLGEPIELGLLIHDCLKFHYIGIKNGLSSVDARTEVIKDFPIFSKKYSLDASSSIMVRDTYLEYTDFYVNDLWIPELIEEPFSTQVYEDDKIIILWEGIMDFFGQNQVTKKKAPMDHKSSGRKNYANIMANQFIGYATISDSEIVIVNHITFKKGKEDKFRREILNATDKIKADWLANLPDHAYRLIECATKNRWPMRHHSCNAMYGCKMRDYCSANEPYREWLMKTQYKIGKKWDPFTRD